MEFIQGITSGPPQWLGAYLRASDYANLFTQFLPPSIWNPLLKFVTTTFGVFKTLQSHLTPFLLRVTTQPDLASIAVLLIVLFVSFKVVDMAYRAVMFWVNLVLRLMFWGAIFSIGVWVYSRGLEGFTEDVQDLAEYWSGEYQRYSGEVKRFQTMKENQIRMQQGGRGGGRGWR
jgi:hypothetical protein